MNNTQSQIAEARRVLRSVIPSAFDLLPSRMESIPAKAMILAVGFQETKFETRVQHGGGPAHSYWQFEKDGGIAGVLRHHATSQCALAACRVRQLPSTAQDIWDAMVYDDVIGAVFARLLLFSSPRALPGPQDVMAAWFLYADELWRPGVPRFDSWHDNWRDAWRLVEEPQ